MSFSMRTAAPERFPEASALAANWQTKSTANAKVRHMAAPEDEGDGLEVCGTAGRPILLHRVDMAWG